MRPSTPHDGEGLGTFDAEPIDLATITLGGGGGIDRRLTPGERVILVAEGTVTDGVTVRRVDGRLVRQHRVKVDRLAEPFDELADETAAFLTAIADELEGRTQLPFDLEDGDADTPEGEEDE